MRPREAEISTPAEIKASDALREAALDACPQRVLGFEGHRLLPLPCGLDRIVVGLRPDRELAWSRSRRGACLTGGTRATGGPVKPDANHGIARDIVSRPPVDAGISLGTVRPLGVPIQDKGLQVIAQSGLPLPAVGPKRRTNQVDLMLGLGGDQEIRIHIAAVE